MGKQPSMADTMAEVSRAIEAVRDWTRTPDVESQAAMQVHDAHMWQGNALGWHFVVTDFDIEYQGFPPGSRGWDGVANNMTKAIVYHLTRDQAMRAVALAATARLP